MKKLYVFVAVVVLAAVGYLAYSYFGSGKSTNDSSSIVSEDGYLQIESGGETLNYKPVENAPMLDFGIEIYPGATQTESGDYMSAEYKKGDKKIVSGVFLTTDSADKVSEYYKSKMSQDSTFQTLALYGKDIWMGQTKSGNLTVEVFSEDGKTYINIIKE